MNRIILTSFVAIMVLLAGQTACTYEHIAPAPVACDTTEAVTFSGNVQPILVQNCTFCHEASSPQGDVDLSTWAATEAYALSGSLVGSMAHESGYSKMPKNTNRLSDCEINQVRRWVLAGAKND